MKYPIQLQICKRSDPRYQDFRNRHYVTNRGCHGQQLHYLVWLDGDLLGIISGASAVYSVKPRDEFFGITKDLRRAQLNSIINNVVFRIENAPPNAATQVLAMWRKRIARDWEYLYGVPVAGFETFVIEGSMDDTGEICTDRDRTGSLYLADNWTSLGLTQGSTKAHGKGGMESTSTRREVCQKLILVRKVKGVPLCTDYQSSWKDPVRGKIIGKRRQELFKESLQLESTAIIIQP